MKPIPAPTSHDDSTADFNPSNASNMLKSATGHSNVNRRTPQANVNRVYPWLLVLSTGVAVFFGYMYISKPVVIAGTGPETTNDRPAQASSGQKDGTTGLLPGTTDLPGENGTTDQAPPTQNLTTAPIHSRFEETNMRVQHILTATSESGHVSRIDLEVPVLYQSRNLRWTPAEVARAQDLMMRLMDYQDKSRQLRSQGEQLLIDWNALIGQSIPTSRLRADSPSIPDNQQDGLNPTGTTDTTTSDAIEIDSKEDKP